MTSIEKCEAVSYPAGDGVVARDYSYLEQMLGYIVFEGHSLRIGLELSACVLGHLLLLHFIPWELLGFSEQWASVYSWFACCLIIAGLDLGLLCRNAHVFRRAYLLGLKNEFAKASELLERIGPYSSRWIRLPRNLYHLYKAEIAAHTGNSTRLGAELDMALEHGVAKDRMLLQKVQLLRAIGEVDTCREVLETLGEEFGENSELLVEQVRTLIAERSSWGEAKRIARQAKKLPDRPHASGEMAHRLAAAYEAVAMLWSGEAEEGLEQLNNQIELIRRSMLYVDTLRPIFAQLLLERGYYLVTHKEPTLAVYDYTLSAAICSLEEYEELSATLRAELLDRYAIALG